jgi:hypothetical protein
MGHKCVNCVKEGLLATDFNAVRRREGLNVIPKLSATSSAVVLRQKRIPDTLRNTQRK